MVIPEFLLDVSRTLTSQGFISGTTWYHGTSSGLWPSIQQQGLKRSGDQALIDAAKKTLSTIGDQYVPTTEPVFLSPSKALAYFWATEKVRERQVRLQLFEEPIVLQITLSDELSNQVEPDVGAMGLLLLAEGEKYLAFVEKLFQDQGLEPLLIDLQNAKRMEYLEKLGMAYIDQAIPTSAITLLNEDKCHG
jgi:hypothetical protein